MFDPSHIDPVSIHSLLTTTAVSRTGRSFITAEGEERIAAADVIFARDTDTGVNRLVHGRRVLENCETPSCILRVEMDRDTNELEHLAAAITLIKGECDTVDESAGDPRP